MNKITNKINLRIHINRVKCGLNFKKIKKLIIQNKNKIKMKKLNKHKYKKQLQFNPLNNNIKLNNQKKIRQIIICKIKKIILVNNKIRYYLQYKLIAIIIVRKK